MAGEKGFEPLTVAPYAFEKELRFTPILDASKYRRSTIELLSYRFPKVWLLFRAKIPTTALVHCKPSRILGSGYLYRLMPAAKSFRLSPNRAF